MSVRMFAFNLFLKATNAPISSMVDIFDTSDSRGFVCVPVWCSVLSGTVPLQMIEFNLILKAGTCGWALISSRSSRCSLEMEHLEQTTCLQSSSFTTSLRVLLSWFQAHRLLYLCPVADDWFHSHLEGTATGVSLFGCRPSIGGSMSRCK